MDPVRQPGQDAHSWLQTDPARGLDDLGQSPQRHSPPRPRLAIRIGLPDPPRLDHRRARPGARAPAAGDALDARTPPSRGDPRHRTTLAPQRQGRDHTVRRAHRRPLQPHVTAWLRRSAIAGRRAARARPAPQHDARHQLEHQARPTAITVTSFDAHDERCVSPGM